MTAPRSCFIDDCREPATYFVHSYPDDVRLCDRHKSLHPVELMETLCLGPGRCSICEDESFVVNASAIGNPDETPVVFVGAGLRALLNPCVCGGVNGYHADDCEATR